MSFGGAPQSAAGAADRRRAGRAQSRQPTLDAIKRAEQDLAAPPNENEHVRRFKHAHAVERAMQGARLGAKRNWLAAAARGALLANFDDDDVYLDSYLERLVGALRSHGAPTSRSR